MAKSSPLAPPDMLCFSLYAAMHALQAAYRPMLKPLGLTYPQYLVMSALWAADGCSVGQISEALHLDSNTLTPLIKRLEGAGLITRVRSAADERQVLVSLTDAGQSMAERAANIPACILKASDLTPIQVDILRNKLTALQKSLRVSAAGPAPKQRKPPIHNYLRAVHETGLIAGQVSGQV